MDFTKYIDLADADGPKLVGHRVWLYHVLREHVYSRLRADQLLERFPTVGMEQIYACLLYFEQHKQDCLLMLDRERARRDRNLQAALPAAQAKYAELRSRVAASAPTGAS